MKAPIILAAALALSLLGGAAASAQTDSSTVTLYALGTDSRFETGCFGPCLCPVLFQTLKGTFELKHVGFDGLFEDYAVSSVQWSLPDGTTPVTIRGSGTYKVGGEVAIEQELTLDLTVGAGARQHFDSGLVSGGSGFPKILIDVSLHRGMACTDTVLHVQAAPDPPASVEESTGGTVSRLVGVAPNPFSGSAEIDLVLARPDLVQISVYDLDGKAVRRIVDGAWLPAGSHQIGWDGRRDSGSMCATGVYFVGARINGRLLSRRVVKVP